MSSEQYQHKDDQLWTLLTSSELDLAAIADFVSLPSCGAQVIFSGQTRDHSDVLTGVTHLEYTAYEEFVLPIFERTARPVLAAGDIKRVAIHHRLGRVGLRESSVVVAVCAPHRSEAIPACHQIIDAVKAEAPIWKKEYSATESTWGEGCNH